MPGLHNEAFEGSTLQSSLPMLSFWDLIDSNVSVNTAIHLGNINGRLLEIIDTSACNAEEQAAAYHLLLRCRATEAASNFEVQTARIIN